MVTIADAREHQELRRVDSPAADNHFAIGRRFDRLSLLQIGHTGATLAVEQQAAGESIGFDPQVVTARSWLEVSSGSAVSLTVLLRDAIEPEPFLGGAVVIVVQRQSDLLACLYECAGQRIGIAQVCDVERPSNTVILGRPRLKVFRPLEQGKQIGVAPTLVAQRCPMVVVLGVATLVNHCVDGAAAAKHLAARIEHPASVQRGLRFGLIRPVHLTLEELWKHGGDVNFSFRVGRAGFQQKHTRGAALT